MKKNVGEGYKNDEITSNILKNVEKKCGGGVQHLAKKCGGGVVRNKSVHPQLDTIKNGIALMIRPRCLSNFNRRRRAAGNVTGYIFTFKCV